MTRAEKVTISLPAPLLDFVTQYQESRRMSRSEVIQQAVKSLQDAELARAYREAGAEMQADPLFDLDSGHGLSPADEPRW
ncbi:ribbon-helix-helix domain-containing protein [Deinococcus sp.]|uniref:ribbon-helix-helix domain-containing protein n=1 Tax=Deinococcus sp. TaxID=47478 RepID=UPI003CC5516D